MTSASNTAHTIAGNFQGIYSKHHDSGAEILKPTVAVVDRLYVNGTTYSLPG